MKCVCKVPCTLPYSQPTSAPHPNISSKKTKILWRIHTIFWLSRGKRGERGPYVSQHMHTHLPCHHVAKGPPCPGGSWLKGDSQGIHEGPQEGKVFFPTLAFAYATPHHQSSFALVLHLSTHYRSCKIQLIMSPLQTSPLHSELELSLQLPSTLELSTPDFTTLNCHCGIKNPSTLLFCIQR